MHLYIIKYVYYIHKPDDDVLLSVDPLPVPIIGTVTAILMSPMVPLHTAVCTASEHG